MRQTDNGYECSVYSGELTTQCIIDSTKKMKKAFPSLPLGFYEILTDRLKELGFSDKRLIDAVNHVVDTCIYPTPTIANFISFDRVVKFKTYEDMLKLADEFGSNIWNSYDKRKINGTTFWHLKTETL